MDCLIPLLFYKFNKIYLLPKFVFNPNKLEGVRVGVGVGCITCQLMTNAWGMHQPTLDFYNYHPYFKVIFCTTYWITIEPLFLYILEKE